jgi:hypothetical protein
MILLSEAAFDVSQLYFNARNIQYLTNKLYCFAAAAALNTTRHFESVR